jgi:peroxiredoxin
MRPDITVGATCPDYALPDHTGTRRRLSELQGNDPMILIPSRGHYCPKDCRQLRYLVDFYPELRVGYTRVALLWTDNLLQTHEHREGLGAQWPFHPLTPPRGGRYRRSPPALPRSQRDRGGRG